MNDHSRERLSAGFATATVAAIALLGVVQFAKDGSFWVDEASVAASLVQLSPTELFGRLLGGQSFPRWLLLSIQATTAVFGFETMVARALPQVFFLLGSAVWGRLLYLRFRGSPLLVAIGGLLLLMPTSWPVYGAMLKPYSFDVFLAALPFLLGDVFYERALVSREGPGKDARLARSKLFALTLPVALSYPFGLALLARVGGWWLKRAATGRPQLALPGALAGISGLALFAACLWWTDLRHTSDIASSLHLVWGRCVIGHPEADTLVLLDRFGVGWWQGAVEFARSGGVGAPVAMVLRVALVAGLLRVAFRIRDVPDSRWGSRSLGFAVLILGLPVASWVIGYPICSGRLTFFALIAMVTIALEGLAFGAALLGRLPGHALLGHRIALGLGVLLLAAIAPPSLRDAARVAASPTPTDLRPLIEMTRERPELPILTNRCTQKQIDALPEGMPAPVLRIEEGGGIQVAVSESREAWLLIIPSPYCSKNIRKLRRVSERFEAFHDDGADAQLIHVRVTQPRPRTP